MQTQTPARRGRQHVMAATTQKISDFQAQIDLYAGHLQQALPRHVSLDRFKRILVTAASTNPDLLLADRRSLMLSAIRCASDGLMPDGRQAALVVYNTEIKRRDPETGIDHRFRIDAVQYLPMIAGIRERMRNTGEIASADAQVVHQHDSFRYELGDTPFIEHKPPPLSEDRGDIVGAYAIIKLKNGEVLRDVMSKKEIEQTRAVSQAKNGPMWTKFYGEACRKTVLRRCSKAAPQTSDLDRLIGAEEDEGAIPMPALAELSELPAPEPEPILEVDPPKKRDPNITDVHNPTATPSEAPGEAKAEPARVVAEPPKEPDSDPPATLRIPNAIHDSPGGGRNWAFALFVPKLRQMNSSTDLALFLGDNEANLEKVKRLLNTGDRHELEQEIDARWHEVEEMEREPAG